MNNHEAERVKERNENGKTRIKAAIRLLINDRKHVENMWVEAVECFQLHDEKELAE